MNEHERQPPEQIEREIEATRERVSQNIDELGERLSPDNLKRQAKDAITGKARDIAYNAGERTRETGFRMMADLCDKPLVNMESAMNHPCQALADWHTMDELRVPERGKFVLTWANHPRALPLAVPSSTVPSSSTSRARITSRCSTTRASPTGWSIGSPHARPRPCRPAAPAEQLNPRTEPGRRRRPAGTEARQCRSVTGRPRAAAV